MDVEARLRPKLFTTSTAKRTHGIQSILCLTSMPLEKVNSEPTLAAKGLLAGPAVPTDFNQAQVRSAAYCLPEHGPETCLYGPILDGLFVGLLEGLLDPSFEGHSIPTNQVPPLRPVRRPQSWPLSTVADDQLEVLLNGS